MAQVERSAACLRIHGEDLDPGEITRLLGVTPTYTTRKGEKLGGEVGGRVRIAKAGMWSIEASERSPEDLDGQIEEILSQATGDPAVWRTLGEKYPMDLFCGLFLGVTNEGMSLSAKSLAALGERGIELELDIYSGGDEDEETGN
ncbi:DUF4279 domain-containing protein [Haloferula sp. BvORR071]|uniref:DUF4279 domain-containing protein n=1 Tax=Haloferula sp. BvORR071 TaxID=1396141 RepID=UPI000552EAAB|nr:DUF4279 domain-containing protein [Haloferula sp. BvORR071]